MIGSKIATPPILIFCGEFIAEYDMARDGGDRPSKFGEGVYTPPETGAPLRCHLVGAYQHDERSVTVCGVPVGIVSYKGEPVVTFAMVDKVHQRPEGTAGRTFRENRGRFVEGEDFIEVTSDEIRRQSLGTVFPARTPKGVLITRRGYLKLVKPLTDDRAWEVQVAAEQNRKGPPPFREAGRSASRLALVSNASGREPPRCGGKDC